MREDQLTVSECFQVLSTFQNNKTPGNDGLGGRPAKLNEKKGDRDLEREIKNKGDIFFVGRTISKFCNGGDKMRNANGHQCKVKMSFSEKNV